LEGCKIGKGKGVDGWNEERLRPKALREKTQSGDLGFDCPYSKRKGTGVKWTNREGGYV
jgi:hypothetical protein